MKMSNRIKAILPVLITVLVIVLFHYTQWLFVKFYPVCANLTVFLVFFCSLFTKETVIQKFAKMVDGELSENALKYTRNLTYIWCVLTFFNFVVSFITVFLSEEIWALFNGLISYILIGTLFFVEYVIRTILKKKNII